MGKGISNQEPPVIRRARSTEGHMRFKGLKASLLTSALVAGMAFAASPTPASAAAPVVYTPWTIRPNASGNPEAFGVGNDNQIYHRYWNGSAFTDWSTLGGLPGGVAVASAQVSFGINNLNNPELFVTGVDGNVYHDYSTPGVGSGWSGWSTLAQPSIGGDSEVTAGRNFLNNQELYIVGKDGYVYHKFATPGQGSGWSNWDTLGTPAGTTVKFGVHVGRNYLNNQELYVIGANGVMYHDFATPGKGSGWNGWDPVAPVPTVASKGDVNVGLNFLGNQELYYVGTDGNVYHNYSTPGQGSGWSDWSSLGAPPGVTLSGFIDIEFLDYRSLNFQDLLVYGSDGKVYEDDSTPGVGSGWSGWTLAS